MDFYDYAIAVGFGALIAAIVVIVIDWRKAGPIHPDEPFGFR